MAKGKKKSESVCCVLTLPLLTEPWQDKVIETRFRIMEQLKNGLIAKELGKLKSLERTREWKRLNKEIKGCDKEKDEKKLKTLYEQRSKMIQEAKLSEWIFDDDIIPMQKHFVEHIFSDAARRAASDIWRSFEKYLFGGGKTIHYCKHGSLDSIASKYPRSGMRIEDDILIWNGGRSKNCISLQIRIRRPRNAYETEMMSKSIRNMRVVRKWMKTRYKYYLQITFDGRAVTKNRAFGNGRVGIDIGTQTIAWSSSSEVRLAELAAGIKRNHKEKVELQRKMDRSRRATNPQNYNADGTVKRGRRKWIKSKHYIRMEGRVRELDRKNAAIRKYEHTCMANHILSLGNEIYIEQMNFKALQKRAKETKLDKNGRIARKKRFGKSIANRAPGMFTAILKQKCASVGAEYHEVETKEFKASQYDHTSNDYKKKTLAQRWNYLHNGDVIQRDLYSAFLLMNSDSDLTRPDRDRCIDTYENFHLMHDLEMERLRMESTPHISSMGVA